MTNPVENRAAETASNNHSLLAELESRQDELLRMLTDLEERTKQALAQLSPAATTTAAIAPKQAA